MKNNDLLHLQPIGLWGKDEVLKFYAPKDPKYVSHSALNLQRTDTYFEAPVRRLSHVMRDNGHQSLDLLKINIEGAEYDVIKSILEDDLDIRVLCVDFDEKNHPVDGNYMDRIKSHIGLLNNAGYGLVSVQNWGNYTFIRNARP